MAVEAAAGMPPVMGFALVGALGVGAQWLAWRLRMPAIVLMLLAGLAVGPGLGIFDPREDIGPLMQPMIAIAVAIILFEGGLTLNIESLRSAAVGVRRLVFVGAPVGWLGSTLALHYVAGLSWATSAVFGGIMIVTGPTVIAPLLRQARLRKRPGQLLQWEAIVNDPIGALAAVLAFELVLVMQASETIGDAAFSMLSGITVATILGLAAGWALSEAFRRAYVPEYMKVPVLFAVLLGVFALSDYVLHESGLLAVTVMGIWMANAHLPSYTELRRFKEHATVLAGVGRVHPAGRVDGYRDALETELARGFLPSRGDLRCPSADGHDLAGVFQRPDERTPPGGLHGAAWRRAGGGGGAVR